MARVGTTPAPRWAAPSTRAVTAWRSGRELGAKDRGASGMMGRLKHHEMILEILAYYGTDVYRMEYLYILHHLTMAYFVNTMTM